MLSRTVKSLLRLGFLVLMIVLFYVNVASRKSTPPGVVTPQLFKTKSQREANSQREAVVSAFNHAWNGYEEHAFGYDEYHPISKKGSDWFSLGLTIIDSLDTAFIMKQEKIYQRAKNWVAKDLNFNQSGESNVFEITIRVLGGLLSTYNLSKDEMFLEKAVVLADKLLVCFDSPSNIPISSINLLDGVGIPSYNGASTSEATTLQMEFKYLSYLTKDPKYWNAVQLVMKKIFQLQREDGLVPIFISTDTGKFITDEIRLGSRGDSYYEYLIKQYLLTKEQEPILKFEYEKAIQGVRSRLLRLSSPSNLFFVGETTTKKHFSSKMDHLVCFLPGTMAWKATKGEKVTKSTRMLLDPIDLRDLELAEELTRSCVETYFQTQTGLSPEIVFWNENIEAQKSLLDYHTNPKITPIPLKSRSAVPYDDESDLDTRFGNIFETPKIEQDFQIHPQDGHNLLRPETIETLFILYRITGKTIYRTWGWKIFKKFEKYSKLESGGYCSLDDVRKVPPIKRDKMETFFLGETLKYFYLLFDDEELFALDRYVFNTEAHPFPVFDTSKDADFDNKLLRL